MKRSRINPVSAKKRAKVAAYSKARQEVYDRCGGRCEARIYGVCTGWMQHAHHRRLRSQGGSDDPSNLVGICHRCHDFAHAHPRGAAELGLIEFTRAPDPLSTAVLSVERRNGPPRCLP